MSNENPVYERSDIAFYFTSVCTVIALSAIPYGIWIKPIEAFRFTYVQIDLLFIYIMCYVLLFIFWLRYYFREPLAIYYDRIEIMHRFRSTEILYFKDLKGWEKVTGMRYVIPPPPVVAIYLSFQTKTISINESLKPFEHLDDLDAYFTERGFRQYSDPKTQTRSNYKLFALFGSLFLFYLFSDFCNGKYNKPEKGTETITLKGLILNGEPEILEYHIGKNESPNHKLKLKVSGIDSFTFIIENEHDILENEYYLKSYNKYDSINIEMLKYDYEIKIAHTRTPSFGDKHFDWSFIQLKKVEFPYFQIMDL